VWDPVYFGKVTVKNASDCTNNYSFIAQDVTQFPDDASRHPLIAVTTATLAPGQTATLTLGFPVECGHTYSRGLIFGYLVKKGDAPSDFINYPVYAPGNHLRADKCDELPVIAPPPLVVTDVCPNIDGIQSTVPEGMHLVEGQCVAIVTDVCPNIAGIQSTVPEGMHLVEGQCVAIVTDVCPNIAGIQSTVPEGMHLVEGQCVEIVTPPTDPGWCHVANGHSGTVENTLTIPANAIQNGHVGKNGTPQDPGYPHPNWRDELDYPGACDGRSLRR
jgi:hypothetical protein